MVESRLTLRNRIIGVLLRDARRQAGRTRAECAEALGMPLSRIDAYEEGRAPISLPELEALGYLLGIAIDRFWESEPELDPDRDSPDLPATLKLRNRVVGALLRQARQEASMTQEDLAEVIDCPPSRIAAYENAAQPIPIVELELLGHHLGLPLEHFLDGQQGTVGAWHRQQAIDSRFHELPHDVQAFVAKPVNIKYLEVAMRLSRMPASKLRGIAEGLLEITY
jgi:transcriptional regulator with XRE-family HTH domain